MREPFIGSFPHSGNVVDHIRHSGSAVLGGLTFENFMEICQSIGDVVSLDDIEIVNGSSAYVANSGAIPPHSDPHTVNIVAWLCVRQDEEDGTSILFDTTPKLRSFSSETRSQLASIPVDQLPDRPGVSVPLLRGYDEASWRVYYTPWLLSGSLDAGQRRALAVFQNAIECSEPTRIRMQPGQSLFVNNWRILHSRDALKPDSARLLKRAWVHTPRHRRILSAE